MLAWESGSFLPVTEQTGPEKMSFFPVILSFLWLGLAGWDSSAWTSSQHPKSAVSHPLPRPMFSSTFHRHDPRRHRSGIQEILATDGSPCREGEQQLGKALGVAGAEGWASQELSISFYCDVIQQAALFLYP